MYYVKVGGIPTIPLNVKSIQEVCKIGCSNIQVEVYIYQPQVEGVDEDSFDGMEWAKKVEIALRDRGYTDVVKGLK